VLTSSCEQEPRARIQDFHDVFTVCDDCDIHDGRVVLNVPDVNKVFDVCVAVMSMMSMTSLMSDMAVMSMLSTMFDMSVRP
jgi:hypothetical protein